MKSLEQRIHAYMPGFVWKTFCFCIRAEFPKAWFYSANCMKKKRIKFKAQGYEGAPAPHEKEIAAISSHTGCIWYFGERARA